MLIEIFTRPDCPACQRTKTLLKNSGYNYTEWELGRNITREDLLLRFPYAKFVPIIIVDNEMRDNAGLQLLLEQKSRVELLKD